MDLDLSRTSCEHSSPSSVHNMLLTTSKLSALGVASSAAVVPVLSKPGGPGIIRRRARVSLSSSKQFCFKRRLRISATEELGTPLR